MAASKRSNVRAGAAAPQRVCVAAEAQRSLQLGIRIMEQVLGPTLGPAGRPVAIERIGRPRESPELVEDGGTIAQRMTGIPDRFGNAGFMLARHVAWQLAKDVGDGSATAIVIFAAAHRYLMAYAAAGADPISLQRGVNHAVREAEAFIDRTARPFAADELERFPATCSHDPAVKRIVTDAVAFLGQDAVIVVRESSGTTVRLECIEGALWETGLTGSMLAANGGTGDVALEHPRVLLWDAPIDEPGPLAAALAQLRADSARSVLVVSGHIAPAAAAVLVRNNVPDFRLAAVLAPGQGTSRAGALQDLAVLTGGRVLAPDRGDTLRRLDLRAVGAARRVAAGQRYLNILATDATAERVGTQAAAVRRLIERNEEDHEHRALMDRLGRLEQGMGIIWVGASTSTERDLRRRSAERAVASLRAALGDGIVPGGGATYLGAARSLGFDGANDEQLGVAAVARALEAPAWWIARNAGLNPDRAVGLARPEAPVRGIDAHSGELVDLAEAGIVDAARIVRRALTVGATAAALAMSCDVLVHCPVGLFQARLRP